MPVLTSRTHTRGQASMQLSCFRHLNTEINSNLALRLLLCSTLLISEYLKLTRQTVALLCLLFGVCLQPLNPRQAMVKRLSVVNLENFRRQYARRRWKVNRTDFSLSVRPQNGQGLISFHFFFFFLVSNRQLSFRIVALCNHLTRIMKKGHKLPEEGVRTGTLFTFRKVVGSYFCTD